MPLVGATKPEDPSISLRVLISTSLHEHLASLAAFHLNWHAALSGRMVTLAHLSANTRAAMLQELPEDLACGGAIPSGDGLVINPTSIPTRFGTAFPTMIHNHRTAARMDLQATHICLASPYLYALESSLDQSVEANLAALPATCAPLQREWPWFDKVAADARLTALSHYLNVPLVVGRADGAFLTTELFDTLLEILLRFFSIEEIFALNPVYPLEEIVLPTILPVLLAGTPGRITATRARIWDPQDPPTPARIGAAIASGLYASGKRIPQMPGDPTRHAVLTHLPGLPRLQAHLGSVNV